MSTPYVRHYDNNLLDDLHNIFPELLYGDVNQFRSVADVLVYMRRQIRNRMDLYTAAARAHEHRPATYVGAPTPTAAAQPVLATPVRQLRPATGAPAAAAPPVVRLRTQTLVDPPSPIAGSTVNDLLGALDLMNMLVNPNSTAPASLLGSLFSGLPAVERGPSFFPLGGGGGGAGGGGGGARFMDPVPVRPTAQQIAENTVIETVDAEEEVCAICQDEMPAGSDARALNACDHRFHVGCIDTWFQRDVHCPVCRHDVREPALGAAPATAPAAPVPTDTMSG